MFSVATLSPILLNFHFALCLLACFLPCCKNVCLCQTQICTAGKTGPNLCFHNMPTSDLCKNNNLDSSTVTNLIYLCIYPTQVTFICGTKSTSATSVWKVMLLIQFLYKIEVGNCGLIQILMLLILTTYSLSSECCMPSSYKKEVQLHFFFNLLDLPCPEWLRICTNIRFQHMIQPLLSDHIDTSVVGSVLHVLFCFFYFHIVSIKCNFASA